MPSPKIQRALISVSDKQGLAAFARGLARADIEIFSTGGTRKFLGGEGIHAHEISGYTGFPEMMDGRLKTLHPKVFGGILARRDRDDDLAALRDSEILPFDLVVVNLYPFEATVARPGVTRDEAIEQIDIGGPSLVRAAAKNYKFVTIVTRPEQYAATLDEIVRSGGTTLEHRERLAGEAFQTTAAYDRTIADYFAKQAETGGGDAGTAASRFPLRLDLPLERVAELRYGENPHQPAALYAFAANPDRSSEVPPGTGGARQPGDLPATGPTLVSAKQLHGKELSYNNLLDLDSAWAIVRSLPEAAAAVIKHNNPCGAAMADSLDQAAQRAMDGDPISAFGSVLGFNRSVDRATAEVLAAPGLFIEAIVAPHFEPAAVELLTTRPKWKANVRLLEIGQLAAATGSWQFRQIDGGMLVQGADVADDPRGEWVVATHREPDARLRAELEFAWSVARHVKSNAIVLCQHKSLCGVGAGQMSRVDSVDIAIRKAGSRAAGAVLASDAFFPFPDSIHQAASAGVAAIIQPGGSKNDDEVIAACNDAGVPMIFTRRRHFRH